MEQSCNPGLAIIGLSGTGPWLMTTYLGSYIVDQLLYTILYMLWFNYIHGLYFLLFQTHYHVIIMHYLNKKQRKTKFKPRIKLNPNIIDCTCISGIQQQPLDPPPPTPPPKKLNKINQILCKRSQWALAITKMATRLLATVKHKQIPEGFYLKI